MRYGYINLTGQKWRYLTAIKITGQKGKRLIWLFKCDCGKEAEFIAAYVKEGKIISCGCLNKNGRPRINHGATVRDKTTSTYVSYNSAKVRCYTKSAPNYPQYGGRGISMCERWKNDFREFLKDMGERPIGTTLDRYPNKDGNYETGNCRWATPIEQQANRDVTHVNENGVSWVSIAMANGITKGGFDERIRRGWSYQRASTEPMWRRGRRANKT